MAQTIIGFDAKRVVRNATGLGNYSRTLVNSLAEQAPADWQLRLYAPDGGREELRSRVELSDRMPLVTPRYRLLKMQRAWWRVSSIVGDLWRDGVQLFHGLSGELPHGLQKAGISSVVTIHDLIFMRHPEYYHRVDAAIYRWKFHAACREADHIIAISECTKRDIMELGGVDEERISVVYQSCAPRFTTAIAATEAQQACQRYGLPPRFVLSVGTIEERKNILLAVRALRYLPAEIHLVAVGRRTKYADHVLRAIRSSGLEGRVHFLSGVSDADLQALYQTAEVFVYPSRYEGFGLPVIEAIHCGLPVVAATGSCLEEAGGPHSLYVAPDDASQLGVAISRLLRGAPGREQRIRQSRDYVRRFESNDAAERILDIYRRLIGRTTV